MTVKQGFDASALDCEPLTTAKGGDDADKVLRCRKSED